MECQDFEARTEAEAIELAAAKLGLEPEQFEVELLVSATRGLFRRGKVKIRVYPLAQEDEEKLPPPASLDKELHSEIVERLEQFFGDIFTIVGFSCQMKLRQIKDHLLEIELVSEDAGYLIGHHGKHLEALQVLTNAFLSNYYQPNDIFVRVLLDTEGYRHRREKQLQRLAKTAAERVLKSHNSELLEPMSAFERRLVHLALSDINELSTVSEGGGDHRQVRIVYRS